ncbi:lysine histidine transporter-like 8 [Quercus suber]|uniref:Lysine histidine transporter-like 8 n=1 Tax=Quercus suber TaxID=58331 RepID=A0AAW0KDS8_QUESU
MDLIFKTLCDRDAMCHAKSLTNTEWFLVFTCLAILIAQLPNLNYVAWVSLIGAITVVLYSSLIWALSIIKDRPIGISYSQFDKLKSNMEKFSDVLNVLGIIALAFKGHNVILEIQGIYGYTAYSASKFGLRGLAEALQQEVIADDIHGIRC